MNGRDFLRLARQLAAGRTEAEWRTAIGRAYYAAFHVARQLLEDLKFRVPHADRAHKYLALRLSNAGDPAIQLAGSDLDQLRSERNHADYDLRMPLARAVAATRIQLAEKIIRVLDALDAATRTQMPIR